MKIHLSTELRGVYQHYTQLFYQKVKKKMTNNQQNYVIHIFNKYKK